jgi:hypothetical protein
MLSLEGNPADKLEGHSRRLPPLFKSRSPAPAFDIGRQKEKPFPLKTSQPPLHSTYTMKT